MKLILTNGYPYPCPAEQNEQERNESAEQAARTQLEINGVVHFEWLHTVTVEFQDMAAFDRARELTGWNVWSELVLEAPTSAPDGYGHPAIVAKDKAYCGFTLIDTPAESIAQLCYKAAHKADKAFQTELERQHGKNAGDYRYDPSKDDERTSMARKAYHRASALAHQAHNAV